MRGAWGTRGLRSCLLRAGGRGSSASGDIKGEGGLRPSLDCKVPDSEWLLLCGQLGTGTMKRVVAALLCLQLLEAAVVK